VPQTIDGVTDLGSVTATTSHYTGVCYTSGKSRLDPQEQAWFEYEVVSIETASEFALYEFVAPQSLCTDGNFYKKCTTTPITQVTFTQPVDE
jgi:hypothetical protein